MTVSDNGSRTAYTTNDMNQYMQAGDARYTYDDDGNMVSKTDATGITSYEYNSENRLMRVVTPADGTWEYMYDAMGNRTEVRHNAAISRYVHDPISLVMWPRNTTVMWSGGR